MFTRTGLAFFYIFFLLQFSALAQDSTAHKPEIHKTKLVGAPIVIYQPETSWQFGAGAKLLFKLQKDTVATRTSFLAFTVRYTLLNQLVINPNYTIFFSGEKYLLKGKTGYLKFPQHYYGIGNNTPEDKVEDISMKELRFDQILYKKMRNNFFAGLGYRYYSTYGIKAKEGGLLEAEKPLGYNGSVASGVSAALSFDSRNNILNTTEGELVEFTGSFHGRTLGGNYTFNTYELDARKYIKVFKRRKDILALHAYGVFTSENTPLFNLASLGGDKIMRGYYKGRYRDNNIAVLQAEYRLPVYKRFGLTFFGGLGDVSHEIDDFCLPDLKPSLGSGLRFLISKPDNLNMRFDYAFGKEGSQFYISIAEAF